MNREHGSVFDLAPPSGGMLFSGPAQNKYEGGKLLLSCPICEAPFRRYPSQTQNRINCYCSAACRIEGSRMVVERDCVQCGTKMYSTPGNLMRITTCSRACLSERRRSSTAPFKHAAFGAYRRVAKEIAKRQKCAKCDVRHGPWAVRGLTTLVMPGKVPVADATKAQLWCRSCHLKDVAPLGPPARDSKPAMKGLP